MFHAPPGPHGFPGYGAPAPGMTQNPLHTVQQVYGMWDAVMREDPSGSLVRAATKGAVVSAVVLGVLGHVLPHFTAKEGIKWGALIGLGYSVFVRYDRKPEPSP